MSDRFVFEGPYHLWDKEGTCYWIRESDAEKRIAELKAEHLRAMNTGMNNFRAVAEENDRAMLIQELRGPDHPLR